MELMTFISFIHIFVAIVLVVFVLLQDSKGGAMGMLGGGGGSNTVFGSTGATSFLVKATRWVAIIFAATCIGLAYMTAHKGSSVLDDLEPNVGAATQQNEVQGLESGNEAKDQAPAGTEGTQEPAQ